MLNAFKRFKKEDVPKLRYGILHSQFGFSDGVSVVMAQVEHVMTKHLKIPKKNIFYLVGKSKYSSPQISEKEILWDWYPVNRLMLKYYHEGYGGSRSEKIEKTLEHAKKVIGDFIKKNKIDIMIVHNSSHPINFISSIALSRHYRDSSKRDKKTPKYILWWHDSHLERKKFQNPANDIEQYLIEGVPGRYVEYIVFINSLQSEKAKKYFTKLDKIKPNFSKQISLNKNVIYNTTDTFIKSFNDLKSKDFNGKVKQFIKDFKIKELLKERELRFSEVLFCLQHTRILNRKRIDFALRYCYELLYKLKRKEDVQAIYFLVSGQHADNSKKRLVKLNQRLSKATPKCKVFLVFAEDYYDKTTIIFEDYPRIFAKLKGFSTFFSEVEGFGNNLLEVLASGLVPVIYKYPVFKKDIEKHRLNMVALDKYEIDEESLSKTVEVVTNIKKRRKMVEDNLKILKKDFPHRIMAFRLRQAITKKRMHG